MDFNKGDSSVLVNFIYEENIKSYSRIFKTLKVMEIINFNDKSLEKHSILIKLVRIITVPMLNSIPAGLLQKVVNKSSPYGREIIARPGTTHSLEVMYTKHERVGKSLFCKIADSFWHNIISQPKAIRNRLRIVEKFLKEEIFRRLNKSLDNINILNIGGGSSRAVIQTISNIPLERRLYIQVSTLDRDLKALELGQIIAQKHLVGSAFNWINGDIRNLNHLISSSFHIVEMVGLLDYFDIRTSKVITKDIFNHLESGGAFIVANVYPNSEMKFVQHVGWPHMYYKTEEDLLAILINAGFKEQNIKMFIEPFKVHLIALAFKD